MLGYQTHIKIEKILNHKVEENVAIHATNKELSSAYKRSFQKLGKTNNPMDKVKDIDRDFTEENKPAAMEESVQIPY